MISVAFWLGEAAFWGDVSTSPMLGGREYAAVKIAEALAAMGWEIPGVKQVFYGVVLLLVVMFLPNGIWPALARRLKVDR